MSMTPDVLAGLLAMLRRHGAWGQISSVQKARLGHSQWMDWPAGSGRELKTCPACSERAGRHVFKPYPDAFGERLDAGTTRPQSWCLGCRRRGDQ